MKFHGIELIIEIIKKKKNKTKKDKIQILSGKSILYELGDGIKFIVFTSYFVLTSYIFRFK